MFTHKASFLSTDLTALLGPRSVRRDPRKNLNSKRVRAVLKPKKYHPLLEHSIDTPAHVLGNGEEKYTEEISM